jgi:hypothetical protein
MGVAYIDAIEAIERLRNAGSAGSCEPLTRVEFTNGEEAGGEDEAEAVGSPYSGFGASQEVQSAPAGIGDNRYNLP